MRILFLALGLCTGALFPLAARAQQEEETAHRVIRSLHQSIYREAELEGGSPEAWSKMEDDAVSALAELAAQNAELLIVANAKGELPLTLAARLGYAPVVKELLRHPKVLAAIGQKDDQGLDAYARASLAQRTTLQACHPEMENPFALVPFYVTQPYYDHRQPYRQILNMLHEAGAPNTQLEAKTYWLKTCTNSDPTSRQAVEEAQNLSETLVELQKSIHLERQYADVEKSAKIFRELFEPRVKSGKMSEEELAQLIDQLYLEKGLTPPN